MPSWLRSGISSKSITTSSGQARETVDKGTRPTTSYNSRSYDSPTENYRTIASTFSSPPKLRPHSRSFSNALPSIFGGAKKRPDSDDDTVPSMMFPGDGRMVQLVDSPKHIPSHARLDDTNQQTGQCATCDFKVKWPKSLSEFRCGNCLMINDVKSPELRLPTMNEHTTSQDSRRADSLPGLGPSGQVLPISIERTKTIIDYCLESYIKKRQDTLQMQSENPTVSPRDSTPQVVSKYGASSDGINWLQPAGSSLFPGLASSNEQAVRGTNLIVEDEALVTPQSFESVNGIQTCSQSKKVLPSISAHPPVWPSFNDNEHELPRTSRKSSLIDGTSPPHDRLGTFLKESPACPPRRQEAVLRITTAMPRQEQDLNRTKITKHIFKPLEDYIIRSLASSDCLNASFLASKAKSHGVARSNDEVQNRPVHKTTTASSDQGVSEFDAKTLLLGDFAENGSWWTGEDRTTSMKHRLKHSRSVDNASHTVHLRTPRIHWSAVRLWYSTVLRAGESWIAQRRQELEADKASVNTSELAPFSLDDVDEEIAEARCHLHRTVLKAIETLLKRPGRPLKTPDDIRFLLILLACPLLHLTPINTLDVRIRNELSGTPNRSVTAGDTLLKSHEPVNITKARIDSLGSANVYGINKRILGLLANLPNDCHHYLTAWFARFNEDQFRSTVYLVQKFLTHRLKRQHGRKRSTSNTNPDDLVPSLSGTNGSVSAELQAALGLNTNTKAGKEDKVLPAYCDDWQVKAAARIMALLFAANRTFHGDRRPGVNCQGDHVQSTDAPSSSRQQYHAPLLSTSEFYSVMVDYYDLIADFDCWESSKSRFSFCQYPFLLPVGAKIRIMEHDAKRQMELKAREAFFDSILKNATLHQYLVLRVRRECLVEDSLKAISEVVGAGQEDIKKGLKIQFVNEEGVDAGGLRKEWFLLLVREIFDPGQGMFVYDEDSHFCYFNPHSFETSDQYFLVGSLLGLAIYNSTILDVALPPFIFKKLLMSGSISNSHQNPYHRTPLKYTISDLAEYNPRLAQGLRQLLDFDGDVESTFCRDFVVEVEKYGTTQQVPLCHDGTKRPVTNVNRQEFVDLYIRFLLDTQVARQFEPFRRGFFTVCGGNALSLFQPEEIEVLIRGSDELLDVPSLKAVAVYENWRCGDRLCEDPAEEVALIRWFWEIFEEASAKDRRKLLSFVTGSDRIPALGVRSLSIKVAFGGNERERYPIARTCFNLLLLYNYHTKQELKDKLWRAVTESEGFGLK